MTHEKALPADAVIQIPADHPWTRLPKMLFAVGGVGIAATFGLGFVVGGIEQAFFSYLTAFAYCLSLALGALFFVIVQHLVRAGWSIVVRRVAESIMVTLPFFAALFIPVLVGFHTTHHHWMGAHGEDPILLAKSGYLNEPFFYIRAVVYFAVWIFLARVFYKSSLEQDKTGDEAISRKLIKFSAPALALYALSQTFAAFDWLMSMDPHWFSTMWGVYYFSGSAVSIFALLIVLIQRMQKNGLMQDIVNTEHYHDLGKFLFGFLVFWTYIAFSQYFLIWYANLPEETIWYEHRLQGSWATAGIFIMIGHFFVPFFFLIPRTIKRLRAPLFIGAVWVLFVHYVDLWWVVSPILHHDGVSVKALVVDLAAVVGVGSIFVGLILQRLPQEPLVPVKDPRLGESLAFENF